MSPAQIIGLLLGLSFIVWIVVLFWVSEFHEAGPWKKKRRQLMALAEEFGLTIQDDGRSAVGEFEGLRVSVGMKSIRLSKSKIVRFWSKLELPDCPSELELREEDIFSGVGRLFGAEELSLGDPEFDAAFNIWGGDLDQVREFLTPNVRSGLLWGMPKLPGAVLRKGAVLYEKSFHTPFFMGRHFQPTLEHFREFAVTLQGDTPADLGNTGVVSGKVRKFAAKSLFLWVPLFLGTLSVSEQFPTVPQGFTAMGLFFTLFALSANEVARVLLQGFYAFMALAVSILFLIGGLDFSELVNFSFIRLDEDGAFPFFLFNFLAGISFFGIRNYLRTLDQTRAVVSDPRSTRPEL